MQLETGTVVDRYAIEGLLGQGGMAIVYRARHQQLGTLHALKLLLLPAKAIRERLVQEGRVQARLRHPNIVNVTDLVEVEGAPGLVMEYVPGPSLDELLRQCELSVEQVDLLARGVLDGVAAAHEVGLVHRDLKPGNVLIDVRKDRLVPKITDFGLAKLLGDEGGGSKTRSGLAMGTPCYMAPEQIRDAKHVDERADVFSLGAVLYEMLTGQRAFDGDDTFEIFSAVTSGSYRPIRELVPQAPDRMVEAVAAALETDRDARVQTVEELARRWSAGTTAPEASVAFAPALLQRAEELGSGTDESGMSWTPTVDPAGAEGGGTAVPPEGGAATMDWSLDNQEEPAPAPSLAPPEPEPLPKPQAQPASNRDPVVRRRTVAIGFGAAITFGLALVLLVGIGGLVGGGLMLRRAPEAEEAAVARSDEVTAPVARADDPSNDAVADAGELGEPEVELPSDVIGGTTGSGSGQARGAGPAGGEAAPVEDAKVSPAKEPVVEAPPAEEQVDPVGEAGGDEEPTAAGSEEPPPEAGEVEEPVATGRVEVSFMLHPMTRGASAIGKAWLVSGETRHALPATVPAGSYRIEASFNSKEPVDVGSIEVPEDGRVQLACFNATKACKPE